MFYRYLGINERIFEIFFNFMKEKYRMWMIMIILIFFYMEKLLLFF